MRPGANSRTRRSSQPNPAISAASMAGAVDLAAIKARTEAAARAAEQPVAPGGANVVDVTEATFQAEVIDRSFAVPVLIDLWAEWCGPCKQLSPVLERLANQANGAWVLAKIDVDANPRISQALQVQSIPTVFAVLGGQLVPGFQGALPEPAVREFIAAVLQAGTEAGLTGAPADDGPAPAEVGEPLDDPRFTAAEEALANGDYATAAERYQAILNAEPGNPDAAAALRQLRLLQRIDSLDPQLVGRADSEPTNMAAQLAAADYAMAGGDVDGALSRLVELIRRLSGEDREQVRDRVVEYFDILGPEDPRVAPARRALASVLF